MIQRPILIVSFPSDDALTAHCCVIASEANPGFVELPDAAGDYGFIGVSQYASDTNKEAAITVAGIVQVVSDGSGTITSGQYLTIASTLGDVKAAATPAFGGATSLQIIGIALSSAAATPGLLVDMLIQPMLHKP